MARTTQNSEQEMDNATTLRDPNEKGRQWWLYGSYMVQICSAHQIPGISVTEAVVLAFFIFRTNERLVINRKARADL
jgi:hypothetical protein